MLFVLPKKKKGCQFFTWLFYFEGALPIHIYHVLLINTLKLFIAFPSVLLGMLGYLSF